MKAGILALIPTALWYIAVTTELAAQSTVVTRQDRLQGGEEDFITCAFLNGIAVNDRGNGHAAPPGVAITGGGPSAAATDSVV
jgi:hypothetical protein